MASELDTGAQVNEGVSFDDMDKDNKINMDKKENDDDMVLPKWEEHKEMQKEEEVEPKGNSRMEELQALDSEETKALEQSLREGIGWEKYIKLNVLSLNTMDYQMEAIYPRTTWVMPMGYEVEEDHLVAYAEHLLAQPVDTSAERFGTYKDKSLLVHNELANPETPIEAEKDKPSKIQFKRKGKVVKPPAPIAPKVKEFYRKRKKEKEKKPIGDAEEETKSEGEKKALRVSGKNSKVVGASTVKAIKKPVTKLTVFEKMLMHIKEYGVLKATKEEIDEILVKAKSSCRSNKRLTRVLIGEIQSIHMETEQILKNLLGLIPNEEEEKLENFETKDILNNVDISDFTPDEIVMGNQLVDEGEKIESAKFKTKIVIILDDDTGIEEEKKDNTNDIQVEGVQIIEQQEQELKRGEEKKTEKAPPVIIEIVDKQIPLVKDKEKT
ncbi:uncharacterized protein LOC131860422 [Cryptomeria japonica]|uniref:uncharacterized protein LOC131860422 n=1 Tax=Cryptomeria japonica TaxID=3369 RepID=UPI0027DA5E0F|nr:uncharacterized protein LOC131860422 [Cryptomeria japonica]